MTVACQRWRERAPSYRPAGEPIDATDYGVELLQERESRPFVELHHYSQTLPAARLHVGLFRRRAWFTPELVGVAVFSVPVSEKIVPKHARGLSPREGVALGRFVLLDDVPANGETWFLARAFRVLEESLPEVRLVVSYSDPVRRVAPDGRVVLPGHVGTIYQAFNGRYVGRASPKTQWLTRDGTELDGRTLTKLRTGDVGEDYAMRQLLAAGAPPRRPGEDGADYVERALAEGPFQAFRHPGNHTYLWALDHRVSRVLSAAKPYPKTADVPLAA